MLHEPASSFDDADSAPAQRAGIGLLSLDLPNGEDSHYSEIRQAVGSVMAITSETFALADETDRQRRNLFLLSMDSKLLMTFDGRLLMDSETAYARLDALFAPLDLLPVFRDGPGGVDDSNGEPRPPHRVYVVQGRVQPSNGGGGLSLVLFLLTVVSVLFVGSLMAINEIGMDDPQRGAAMLNNPLPEIWRGWPYALSILLILGAHEMGHYLAARWHRTAASLPYFLPFPFGLFGTFGAAIRLREPMRNRKVLLDIGAAGPLAGMIFAVPILLIGLATSPVETVSGGLVEGNSILYAASKIVVFGEFLPSGGQDVIVNQLAWAGWTGLLVTGLNLIPVGQLDGGHVLYALLGRYARLLYYPIVGALLLLTLLVASELIVFTLLILLMGNLHAVPLDDITPLDTRRRGVALLALLVFVLVFVPAPLQQSDVPAVPPPGEDDLEFFMLPVATIWLWLNVRGRGWRLRR